MRYLAIGVALLAVIVLTACGATKPKVAVPLRARETDLAGAFQVLRAAGFRVGVSGATQVSSLHPAGVVSLTPRVGSRIAQGSTVTIHAGGGPLGSPAVLKVMRRDRVPSFAGKSLSAAIAWANSHDLFWSVPSLPALSSSDASHLFDAYRVVAQQPRAGAMILQGQMVGGGFRPTPLTLTVAAL